MSELKLQCGDAQSDYLTCEVDLGGINLSMTEDGYTNSVTLTKEDARILADKLYSIVKGE